ncbi:hypothetical protein FRC01_011103 [Tulasnella sp. 417]|nr:hypothetical protein FRC01_011103 [Tulasnella sp. 417]
MSIAPPSRSALIFDGSDPSVPFDKFLTRLLNELQGNHEPLDLVPAHLYGNALRFFESLDTLCQQNAEKLVAVMNGRFPCVSTAHTEGHFILFSPPVGTVTPTSRGQQSDQQLDNQTMPTFAAAPPTPLRDTFGLYKSPSFSTPELSCSAPKGNAYELKSNSMALKRSNIFGGWSDKLGLNIWPFFSKTPASLDIVVHTFFVERFPSGPHSGPRTLIAQIDLSDREAVEQAKTKELVSIDKCHTNE